MTEFDREKLTVDSAVFRAWFLATAKNDSPNIKRIVLEHPDLARARMPGSGKSGIFLESSFDLIKRKTYDLLRFLLPEVITVATAFV